MWVMILMPNGKKKLGSRSKQFFHRSSFIMLYVNVLKDLDCKYHNHHSPLS